MHGTTNKKPIDMLDDELKALIPYVGKFKVNMINSTDIVINKPIYLPEVIVSNPNLGYYDELLIQVAI